jgi:DNA-binding transcriptional LysR family regulator
MELRHLRYFVAVAEQGHITRAAAHLGMQQPPLSIQLQRLEAELQTPLLRRVPRGVELTPAGEVFLQDAKAILASVQHASERVTRVARGHLGRLSVGFTTSAILHPLVARLLRSFRNSFPDVTLDVRENNAAELIQAVAGGDLRAAMLRIPVQRPPGMVFLELLQEELLAMLPSGHPLLDRPAARLDLRDLAGERFILVRQPGAPGIYQNVLAACRSAGFEPQVAAEVSHMLTNLNLVAAGVGISIVPASMSEVRLKGVRYRRLRAAPPLTAALSLAYLAPGDDPILANLIAIAQRLSASSLGQPRP